METKNASPGFRNVANLIHYLEGERRGKEKVRVHVMTSILVNGRNVLNHDSGLSHEKR